MRSYQVLRRTLSHKHIFTSLVAVGVVVGSTLIMPPANAMTQPPGANDCPSGYAVAFANKSWIGTATHGSAADVTKYNEINGYGCFLRSGNTGYMRFRWDAVGKVSATSFYYQIYDCTAGKVAASWNMNYSGTSLTNYGTAMNKSVVLSATHKYAGQVTGSGRYSRAQSNVWEGVLGYFTTPSGAKSLGSPAWFSRTTLCR